ncbi:DUF6457 domain-containing protein [Lipingzhangella sp. LS1_29]|uniref:DUF6457 domain-containing protein n=1 Tax=Lipingzhangella rawalii TaxID=2055835 RepID=A0ABU2H6Q5_9ACTN|nr:DUF6457 domain-containing protein [Lipingzhangella rawalii]MDS1270982.1 DUF6457 domain-containing protein [Lipingzhangella rawalii]
MQLTEWARLVRAELAMEAEDSGSGPRPDRLTQADITRVLDVARDAAHSVTRPAAPVTTYLMGIAVGRGADPEAVAATLRELALAQASEPDEDSSPAG